jgi:hypothetical protein
MIASVGRILGYDLLYSVKTMHRHAIVGMDALSTVISPCVHN